MNTTQIQCNIPQVLQFIHPSHTVNILIQIRQKITIVGILHNNHALFCFWVLCDSINFKEWMNSALGMIYELLNKNKYRVKSTINTTLINTNNYCLPRK